MQAVEPNEDYFDVLQPKGPNPFLFLGVYGMLCLGFFAWGLEFRLVDIDFGRNLFSFLLSVLSAGALFGYMVWRNGLPSMREHGLQQRGSELGYSFLLFVVMPIMIGMLGYPGLFRVANCIFDTSTPDDRIVKRLKSIPIRSEMDGGKLGWFYVLDGGERKWVAVRRNEFDQLKEADKLYISTRSGALGGEWLTMARLP